MSVFGGFSTIAQDIHSINQQEFAEIKLGKARFLASKLWRGPVGEIYSLARFEWNLVAFAIGIAIYFALWFEPDWRWLGLLGLLGLAGARLFAVNGAARISLILIALIVLGAARGAHHTKAVEAPKLPNADRVYRVHGWIEDIRNSGNLVQYYIRVDHIENQDAAKTPHRVRVRLKPAGFVPGDAISVLAVLGAPPLPASAHGYDSGRAAYFDGLGGSGFAIETPQPEALNAPKMASLRHQFARKRHQLSLYIQARSPPHTAGLQAALLTGDRSGIPPEQVDALRDAGLAHVLAISGLHMGLLAGGAYAMLTFLLALITPLSQRYDMRKTAALVGIFISAGYLILSGASVATQRAFIMAAIVFLAVILDRRAFSMRSVALAAAITLIMHPENLLSAGFQMSFAATAALVAVYRAWADRREFTPRGGFLTRVRNVFTGVAMTSFVAGTATGGFAALSFHRFARYGFLANILAMPIFTFIAMPAGFIGLALMPLGLDGVFFKIMGIALSWIISISMWTAELDGAIWSIKRANAIVLCLFGLGFTILCLSPWRLGRIGGLMLGLSLGLWVLLPMPNIRISSQGRVAFWDSDAPAVLFVDSTQADRFGRTQFKEQAGRPDAALENYTKEDFENAPILCDPSACRAQINGMVMSILTAPEDLIEACKTSDLVILKGRSAGPVARRACADGLIDDSDLQNSGGYEISIRGSAATPKIYKRAANPPSRQNRPWGKER